MNNRFQIQRRRRISAVLLPLLLAFVLSCTAQAQRASISGTVADQSGRALPDVRITLLNVDQGLQREVLSKADGSFYVPWLQPGRYVISGQKNGFAVAEIKDVELHVGDSRSVRLDMQVGAAPVRVEVDGSKQAVETVDSTIGEVVTGSVIRDAPLNGRNVLDLAVLQPGVTPTNEDDTSPGTFNVSGSRSDSVNYLLDGGLNNQVLDNRIVYNPNPDTIAEFRILTSNYQAEFGRNSGGIVSILTKSGGNQFHGSAFDFFRNDALDANSFFNKNDPTNLLPRAPLKRNQFGATFGGPLGRADRNNRFFFFLGYQGDRQTQGISAHDVTVFTPAELQGDFSQSAEGAPDPDVAAFLASYPYFQSDPTKQAKAIIDPSAIDPVARNYIAAGLIPTSPTGQLSTQASAQLNSDELTAKADLELTRKDRASITFGWDRASVYSPYSFANVPGFADNSYFGDWFTTVAYTRTFSPNLLSEFRFSFQRNSINQENPATKLPVPSDLGVGVTPDIATGPTNLAFDFGALSIGTGVRGPSRTTNNTFSLAETLTWIRGAHNWKFGGGFSPFQSNLRFAFYPNGIFDFIGSGGAGSQNAFADFLLGIPTAFAQSADAASNIRTKFSHAFAQDEWHVRNNLVLNLGARYEYSTPKRDTDGRTFSVIPGLHSQRFENAPNGMVFPGDPGAPEGVNFPDTNDWAVRAGFAWDPTGRGKTSVRGGFGVFYDLLKGEDNFQFNGQPPFYASAGLYFLPPGNGPTNYLSQPYVTAANSIPNPFPSNPPPPPDINFANSGFLPIGSSGSVFVVDPHLHTPYTYQYSLAVQRSLGANTIAEAAYVGNSSHGLTSLIDVNPFLLGTTDRVLNLQPGNSSCSNDPKNRNFGDTCSFAFMPEFRNVSNASFNSLQLDLRKQVSSDRWFGRSYFTLAYTYAHNIDNASGFRNRNNAVPSYEPALFRASADMDLRQRFIFSGGWELPFDRLWEDAPRAATRGWNVFPIVSYRTGFPLDVFANLGSAGDYTSPGPSGAGDQGNVHANLVAPVRIFDPRTVHSFGGQTGNYWFDPGSFSNAQCSATSGSSCTPGPSVFPSDDQVVASPSLATYGTLSRNYFRAPGRFNINLAFSKITPIFDERLRVEFRADFFNLLNRAQFASPNTNISDPNFGKLQTTYDPRIIQLAIRLMF